MTIEQKPEALVRLKTDIKTLPTKITQRQALWERIGGVKPTPWKTQVDINRIRDRVTLSHTRASLHLERSRNELYKLSQEFGENIENIPYPLTEAEIRAIDTVINNDESTIQYIKDLLGKQVDKNGKPLKWQNVWGAVKNRCYFLYKRVTSAKGEFATDEEKQAWERIKSHAIKIGVEPKTEYEILDSFNGYSKKWFEERKNVKEKLTKTKIPHEGLEYFVSHGKVYYWEPYKEKK